MTNSDAIPPLERPWFFHQQRLTAADLTAAQTYNRELRWLHNRSLHSWGIAFGFGVSGARGATTVGVETGYALDCVGRDLVLDEVLELPIPSVAGDATGGPVTYYLTASYADDATQTAVQRSGDCDSRGAVRLAERAMVRWQDPNDSNPATRYRNGLDVVLGAIRVQNCQLVSDVSVKQRRDAVPPQQPYVASGRTEAGDTAWRLWPNDKAALGVATTVSTSDAGFQSVPRYQAHVVGERMFEAGSGNRMAIVDGYPQIAQATATSFELRMVLPAATTAGSGQVDEFRMEDYEAVVSRLSRETGVPVQLILAMNGDRLFVGQTLVAPFRLPPLLGQLIAADFTPTLTRIAERNDVTPAALRSANGWSTTSISVAFRQKLAIPGPAIPVNPAAVYKPDFMEVLSKEQGWHVVWMGVEG